MKIKRLIMVLEVLAHNQLAPLILDCGDAAQDDRK